MLIASLAHSAPRQLIERRHVGPGMGQHHLAGLRLRLSDQVPALHEGATGPFTRFVGLQRANRLVAVQRSACAPCGQLSRRRPLPVFVLTADFSDFSRAMPLGERPEGRAGFNRL